MTNWTQEREAAARARCDAATEGPWGYTSSKGRGRIHSETETILGGFGRLVAQGPRVQKGTTSLRIGKYTADARFIAHARTDLPDALDEIKRLREELRVGWSHKVICPCAPRISTKNTNIALLDECTCGLDEALHAVL